MSGFASFAPALTDGLAIEFLVRLVLSSLASFLAIILWTRTRDPARMLMNLGTLASYVGVLYRVLRAFGFFSGSELRVFGASLPILVSDNLPVLCFIVAFFVFLRRDR